MNRHELERHLRSLAWPAPSAQLRDRVLSDAAGAHSAAGLLDRVWFSRGWRLAAAFAFGALVYLNATIPRAAADLATARVARESEPIAAAMRELGLPPDVATRLARREAFVARATLEALDLDLPRVPTGGAKQ